MNTPLFHFSGEVNLELARKIFQKDYTSTALTFLDNPARTLNYWKNDIDILPPAEETEKRAKYSFFDIVWLQLVSELKSFGMEKERIAVLKGELLTPINHKEMIKQIEQHRKIIEETILKIYSYSKKELQTVLDEYIAVEQKATALKTTQLFNYIFYTLGEGKTLRLLINKTGNHLPYIIATTPTLAHVQEDHPEFGSHYIVLSFHDIVTATLSLPSLKDELKQDFFSKKEWEIIQLIRNEKLRSLTVHFDKDHSIDLVELSKTKKIKPEARLTEIMIKGAYEKLEVETVKGNIVYCKSTEKRKL